MTRSESDLTVVVTAEDRAGMDRALARAEQITREAAMRDRRKGVLITRNSGTSFTVSVSDEVPYGFTHERNMW